jgi:hypothetical protein
MHPVIPAQQELRVSLSREGPLNAVTGTSFARANAPIEEPTLHRVARQSQRCSEMLARGVVPSAAKLELAERRGVEWILGEAIAVAN